MMALMARGLATVALVFVGVFLAALWLQSTAQLCPQGRCGNWFWFAMAFASFCAGGTAIVGTAFFIGERIWAGRE